MSDSQHYTLAEISKNNGKNGAKLWVIYKEGVYDATDFVKEHPGGSELIEEYAGKDATEAFKDAGHSNDALKILKGLKIGELHPDDCGKKNTKSGPKIVESNESAANEKRSCMSSITCGLCG